MAHKKGQGTSRNGRDSAGRRLGLKAGCGQAVSAGSIIVRQRGTRFFPGANVRRAGDDTLFATESGRVVFRTGRRGRKYVSIESQPEPQPTTV